MALRYVKEQTEEVCKLAVQENGYALQYVEAQTASSLLEISKLAVKENSDALKYVKKEFRQCL